MDRSDQPVLLRSSSSPLERGDLVGGKYRIEHAAGTGGMAVVYAAHHLVLDRRVAVKVLVVEGIADPVMTARFVWETHAAARLQCEHAARMMDAGVLAGGQPYLVMEYLDGCDLAELLELNGPLAAPELVDYMIQALDGIAHAHAAGIVHRDVKPSNLFLALRPDGSSVIKVVDFGIAKSMGDDGGTSAHLTVGAMVLGSPAYMSPEQVRSASSVDGRTDIWSLGVSMYELLTGRLPFHREAVGEVLAAVLEADPVPVHEARPEVPRGLSDVVARCLLRQRDDRWADAGELARALAPFGSGAFASYPERIAATLESATRRPPTPRRAFPVVAPIATVVPAGLGGIGATSARARTRDVPVDDLARLQAASAPTLEVSLPRTDRATRWRIAATVSAVAMALFVVFASMRPSGSAHVASTAASSSAEVSAADPPLLVEPRDPVSPDPDTLAPALPTASTGTRSASSPAPAAATPATHRRRPPWWTPSRPAILHARN